MTADRAPSLAAISRALDEMEEVEALLQQSLGRENADRRQQLINLRRRLSAQIAEIGRIADAMLIDVGDAELLRNYRAKFSNMRSATALHQANWPAVMLGEREDEYQLSVGDVQRSTSEFKTWMRKTIAQLQGERDG